MLVNVVLFGIERDVKKEDCDLFVGILIWDG